LASELVHFLFSEVELGHVGVVGLAEQSNVVSAAASAFCIGIVVVKLKPVGLRTAFALVTEERALLM